MDKTIKRTIAAVGGVLAAALLIVGGVFLSGRYGWKMHGWNGVEIAGLDGIEVADGSVTIRGYEKEGKAVEFLGCKTEEKDGCLTVGFRFDSVIGTPADAVSDFEVTIPTSGKVERVVFRGGDEEELRWSEADGVVGDGGGIWLKFDNENVWNFNITYLTDEGDQIGSDGTAAYYHRYFRSGTMVCDAAEKTGEPVMYALVVLTPDGEVMAREEFVYAPDSLRWKLVVTEDGQIVVN